MASRDRVSLSERRGQGTSAFELTPSPLPEEEEGEEERDAETDDKFKMTLYVTRNLVEDFDETWVKVKRGARRSISRSQTFEAAIRVAMEHPEKIRERLGLAS
jgi:hypothetical protein